MRFWRGKESRRGRQRWQKERKQLIGNRERTEQQKTGRLLTGRQRKQQRKSVGETVGELMANLSPIMVTAV